jgi:hypothetical protein
MGVVAQLVLRIVDFGLRIYHFAFRISQFASNIEDSQMTLTVTFE